MKKHHRAFQQLARRYGRILDLNGRHPKMVDPSGLKPPIPFSSSPKNREHALHNAERELKRHHPNKEDDG